MTRALRSLLAEFNRTGHYIYFLENGIPAWTSNGYVAIKQVVSPTSTKADILDKLPDIKLFLVGEYQPATVYKLWDGRYGLTGRNGGAVVDDVYLNKLHSLYPAAQFETAEPFAPVRFVENGEVVALLMPAQT